MKKLLLSFLLLLSPFVSAQKYSVHFKGSVYTSDLYVTCDHWFFADMNFSTGEKINAFYLGLGNRKNAYFQIDNTHIIEKSKLDKLHNVYFTGIRGSYHWGKCKTRSSFNNYIPSKSGCQKTNFSNVDNDGNGVLAYSNIDMTITPIIKLKQVNSFFSSIGYDDSISLSVTDDSKGFPNTDYHWEYQIVDYRNGQNLSNSNWVSLPLKVNLAENITIKTNELSSQHDIGKRIFFRIKTCNNETNTIWYDILPSAPHIISHNNSPTNCFDSTDGVITLNFNRLLKPKETLELELKNNDTGAIVGNYNPNSHLQNSTSYTINNLPTGRYTINLKGSYDGKPTYTDGEKHILNFEIKKPDPVIFNVISKQDVFCAAGSDAVINLSASGGQSQYQYSIDNGTNWVSFNNGNKTSITGLSAGTYKIKVRDTNHCIAKDNGREKEVAITITAPQKAVELSEIENVQPKGYGLSNGYISVRVTGGTPNADGSYYFEWRKDSPTGAVIPISQIITDKTTQPFTILLKNIPAGKYYLTIKDKNHASATSNVQNCGVISQEFIVTQPDPLVVNIKEEQGISCHKDNDDIFKLDQNNNGISDNAEDGILKAFVKGGVGNYSYQWQKKVGGAFVNINQATKNILENLTSGTYKILIKDANDNKTETIFELNFPQVLTARAFSTLLKCNGLENAEASVSASGGTGAYSYLWNTQDTTPKINGLGAGSYFVIVSDTKGCSVKAQTTIEQPGQLEITDIKISNPTCYGKNDGEIIIKASGGKAPYRLEWSNGVKGESLLGLKAGKYILTFTDANGCQIIKEYEINNPEELKIDVEKDITLCLGDSKEFDIKVKDPSASYQWEDSSGKIISTQSKITLSKAGTYTAIITNGKGCSVSENIIIKNSNETLNPQMMIATQAYVERSVKIINTSPIQPDRVEWIIPTSNQIQVIEKNNHYLEVKFLLPGAYKFGLKGYQGACTKVAYKDIVVEENIGGVNIDPKNSSNIKEFTIVPNPNDGKYKVIVKLHEKENIKLRIIDMVSHEPFPPTVKGKASQFEIPFDQMLVPGTYLIVLETKGEVMVKKMLVQ